MLSKQLFDIAQRVKILEEGEEGLDNETMKRYYYGKGALDYRDKLLTALGELPMTSVVVVAYELVRDTFPDPYPGK